MTVLGILEHLIELKIPAATLYIDSSALVKLVQVERESVALRRYLRRHRW